MSPRQRFDPGVRDAQAVVAARMRAAGSPYPTIMAVLAVSESTARDRVVRGRKLAADQRTVANDLRQVGQIEPPDEAVTGIDDTLAAALSRLIVARGLLALPIAIARGYIDLVLRQVAGRPAAGETGEHTNVRTPARPDQSKG